MQFLEYIKNKKKPSNSKILISGLAFTCIVLSISSGLVDIVCFSGLSKSVFHLAAIPIKAAIVYTAISIGLISMKFWCAMKIGMLKELKIRLKSQGFTWYENLNKAAFPWQFTHKILVTISLITALSMSVNSIGSGIRAMQQAITNMTADAQSLVELSNSVNAGVKDRRNAAKDNIYGTKVAQDSAKEEVEAAWSRIAAYQSELDKLADDLDLTDEERQAKKNKLTREAVSRAPKGVNSSNITYMTKTQLRSIMQAQATANEVIDQSAIYDEAISYDQNQIELSIKALLAKEYKYPDGTPLSFTDADGNIVNVQLAISKLQSAISAWQNDTGDVGESSKVFTLISAYIKSDSQVGGMGTTEWLIMLFIFIVGIVQEIAIAICTPAATIDRKTLSSISRYCEWTDEAEKEKFLIKVYKSYVGDGVINQHEFESKCKKSVDLMLDDVDAIIARYSKKTEIFTQEEPVNIPNNYAVTVIEPVVKAKVIEEIPEVKEEPKVEVKEEVKIEEPAPVVKKPRKPRKPRAKKPEVFQPVTSMPKNLFEETKAATREMAKVETKEAAESEYSDAVDNLINDIENLIS